MLRRLCARVYFVIYAHIQGLYAYMEPGKYIYRSCIYVFYVYLFVFVYFSCYICANGCKLVQMHASLHINWSPAASQTGTGHKGHNPYTPPHQNELGKVQLSHLHNKGPTLPMSAISTMAEYRYVRKPKGINW